MKLSLTVEADTVNILALNMRRIAVDIDGIELPLDERTIRLYMALILFCLTLIVQIKFLMLMKQPRLYLL